MMNNFYRTLCIVILFVGSAVCVAAQTGRAATTWNVDRYDINVDLPSDDRTRVATMRAVLSLRNVSGAPANSLTLRVNTAADVSNISINGSNVEVAKSEEKISGSVSLQRIAIRMPAVPAGGTLTAAVDYKLTIKDNNAFATISGPGGGFLPLSYWYPTPNNWFFPRGVDAAPTKIRVNTGNSALTTIAPGVETAGTFENKLRSQPFFLYGRWDKAEVANVAVYTPRGIGGDVLKRSAEIAAVINEARAFTAKLLGPVPDVPIRVVASRRGAGFATGGTFVIDEAVFRRSKLDSQTVTNLAEGVAKLVIGNTTAATGDGFGIIHEGLPRFIAVQFIESKYGKDTADAERLRQRVSYSSVSRRDSPMMMATPVDDFYYPVVANKGAMAWRILAKRLGSDKFFETIRRNSEDGDLNIAELRAAFSDEKAIFDSMLDQVTDTNLLVGIPRAEGGETKIAVRNTGAADVTVDVTATMADGTKMSAPTTIRATSFGEVAFKTNSRVLRVEIDPDKLIPQVDYSDDVAPRETTDSDPILAVKRLFDRQDFAAAVEQARVLHVDHPRFDDLRTLYARSLLGKGDIASAQREFNALLEEPLPTARSLTWANVGLGEIAARAGQNDAAIRYAEAAIAADGELGANLAARALRNRANASPSIDAAVRTFFSNFDKAASSNRKADIDALVLSGEVARFASGVAGSTEQWQTNIRYTDRLDENTMLVEANMTVKLLNRSAETGTAVFRLTRVGEVWRLSGVDVFEVR
jgi:tetratricopeptide (TPR) repeat protein